MRKDIFYVSLQFFLFILYVLLPDFSFTKQDAITDLIGVIMALLGLFVICISILQLNKNISPFPTPKKGGQLITNGIYALVRHPIYLGILVLFFGYGIYTVSFTKLSVTIALAILFHYKSEYEEALLIKRFQEYQQYQKSTNKIIPFI